MNFDFEKYCITLVVAPVDMRSGFSRLALIADACLDIDVLKGEDLVVFISKPRKIVKMIWVDDKGSCLLTRRLKVGTFESFLAKNVGPAARKFTKDDLLSFLDGQPILVKRSTIL